MKLNPRGQQSALYCAILAAATLVTGCASLSDTSAESNETTTAVISSTPIPSVEMTNESAPIEPAPVLADEVPSQSLSGESFYNLFLAELADARDATQSSAFLNYRAARDLQSAELAERALSRALQVGDTQTALSAAELLQSIEPSNPFGFRAAGLLRLEIGEFATAYQEIQTWLALDPTANTAAIARSSQSLERDQRAQLEALVQPISERSTPAAASALLALGLFAELNGASEAVITSFAIRSIERSPSAEAWLLRIRHERGVVLTDSIDEALADFQQDRALHVGVVQRLVNLSLQDQALAVGADWLRYARDDYDLRRYMTSLALQREQWSLVEEIAGPLLSVEQYRNEAWYRIAAARYYNDDLIGAKNAALRVASNSDYYASAWEVAAFVEYQLADVDSTREMLQAERQRRPESGAPLYEIEVAIMREAGLGEQTGPVLKEAIERFPNEQTIRLQYGYWLMTYRTLQEGIVALQPLIEQTPMSHEAANAIAYSYVELGQNFEQAESLLEYALSIEPENPAYLDSLGWLRFKQGKLNESLILLDEALALTDNPEIIAHKIEVLMELGRTNEAKALWENSWQNRPDNKFLADVADRYDWR